MIVFAEFGLSRSARSTSVLAQMAREHLSRFIPNPLRRPTAGLSNAPLPSPFAAQGRITSCY
jgi:hypothetical protein